MPEKAQDPMSLSPAAGVGGVPQPPKIETVDDDEELAKQELARMTPSNEELRKIAAKCGPLPKLLDEDEDPPF